MHRTPAVRGGERPAGLVVLGAAVATVAVAAWLLRSHWFYADDWTFLTRAGADDLHLLVRPANGHWMGATTVVFAGVRSVLGLGAYLPFALPAVLAHAGTGVLLWWWQRRDGVSPWLAAGLAVVFLVYGAAGENLFFAVNVGFNLSLLLGLAFVLLVETPPAERARGRLLLAVVVGLLAVPTSTTGPVVVAGAAAWLAWRRDVWGVLAASPALVAYGGWLLLADGGAGLPGGSPADVAAFLGALVVTAVGRLLGVGSMPGALAVVGALVVAVVGVAVWRGGRGASPRPMTLVLAVAGLAVAGATALARVQYGVETWRSPRYAYVVAALLLPLVAVAVDRVVRSGRVGTLVVGIGLPVAVLVNALNLYDAHRSEVDLEQHLRQRWTAAAQLLTEGVEPVAVNVDRYWAPNLHASHLRQLVADGAFPVPRDRVPDPWRLEAHVELRSVLHGPMPYDELVPAELEAGPADGCVDLGPGDTVDLRVAGPTGVTLEPEGPALARLRTTTPDGRTVALERVLALRAPFPKVAWIDGPSPAVVALSIDGGGRVCPLAPADVPRFEDAEPS